ncbi:MAG: FAD-dependent oxidoreductase [Burkholderiaceae bacterium]|nr:FAD-dependent oxidoreductase [Burkholderiaceae bacterium]
MTTPLALPFGLRFEDLHLDPGLDRLDHAFVDALRAADPSLAQRLVDARRALRATTDADRDDDRASGDDTCIAPDARAEAALLIELGPHVDAFVGTLFGIGEALGALRERHGELDPLYEVKLKFVRREAAKLPAGELAGFDADAALRDIEDWLREPFDELSFARAVLAWQRAEADEAGAPEQREAARARLSTALRYSAWASTTEAGRERHAHDLLFALPAKTDPMRLLGHAREHDEDGVRVFTIESGHLRRRAGFALTDAGTGLRGALDEANYCIWCHEQGKDSCSKGLREKSGPDGRAAWKRSPFGVNLAGCPLEERISEFHKLKARGHAIAALAMIAIDNPMMAATGHRICNDCMKACIYQKQTPVDIPQAETRTLKDVLGLPWGFEIYSLLTRWNPLNLRRPLPRPDSGYRVLVAGMGPAGFTLAHHLMNEGHGVVGIDGLKIEPLDERVSGVRADGTRVPFEPVHDVRALYEPLDDRVMAGFGGVAEYGITVRWNKNFLKLVRLLLERRERFSLVGGVRFGSTLGVDDAFALGFDHVALAIGAGRPTTLDIPNGLARGVRTASDFLMALQLTGAARADSLANMQLRLPVVVIGGGLTAIDTATESLAYYAVQVEKFLARHEALAATLGEAGARAGWRAEDEAVAGEFLAHGRALRAEREAAQRERRAARVVELLQQWGGATIAYRKRLVDSPSYTLNHEEVEKALEEGIRFAECLAPARIDVDAHGAVESITFARQLRDDDGRWRDGEPWQAPARTVFVAAGTQPNTVLAREDATHFALDGRYFRAIDVDGNPVKPDRGNAKPDAARVLLARLDDGRMISFFGDLHPSYFGNVVKAMASARHGYPVVCDVLRRRAPASHEGFGAFATRLGDLLRARIERVERLTPTIVEVVVRAPLAARRFQPGQFYRLQNFEARARRVEIGGLPTTLAMEGLALTGAWVDRERGLVSTIVLEMGGSSNLCADLRPGEPVVLMGPTGAPTGIEPGETVVLVGGGLGNAVLFSIGAAFRAVGSRVLYFAGYKKRIDRYKVAEIEAAADTIVWCCDEAPGFEPGRPQDCSVVGNIVEAMSAFARGELSDLAAPGALRLQDADRIIAIGSDRMMAAVAAARHAQLAPYLKPQHRALGSINAPMQCMMKEVCAQCLQAHKDPVTGKVTYVFTCFEQDQPLDQVDFPALAQRLAQNALQERQTAAWIARCRIAE